MKTSDRIIAARINLLSTQPFFGTLALRLRMREMPDTMRLGLAARGLSATMAVDGKNIWYAPEFVDSLEFSEVEFVIAHEIGHCIYEHIGRRGDRDKNKWNFAGDYVINAMLKAAGFTYGKSMLYDPKYANMTADQVYNLLPDQPGGEGDGGGQPMCDIMDGESVDDPALADDWKIAVAQAAMTAEKEGKLPADMRRFIDDLLNPKVDWKQQLRRFVSEVAKNDYSWMRPNRKMLTHGIYLPGLHSERMGTLVTKIDTSGSLTQEMLTVIGSEVQAIAEEVMPEKIIVIYCDAQINRVDTFEDGEPVELKMVGGGGTSFIPPFEYVEDNEIRPMCSLYFTDGYGPFPDAPPEYPVMWCMLTDVVPPWGERLQVDMSGD
jgi:predicted metal-dependent peptidase